MKGRTILTHEVTERNATAAAAAHLAYGDAVTVLGRRPVTVRVAGGLLPQRRSASSTAGSLDRSSTVSLSDVRDTDSTSGQHPSGQLATSPGQMSVLSDSDSLQVSGSGTDQRASVGGGDAADRSHLGAPSLSLVPLNDASPDFGGSGPSSPPQQNRLSRNSRGAGALATPNAHAGTVRAVRLVPSGWNAGLRSDVVASATRAGLVRDGGRETVVRSGGFRGVPSEVPAGVDVQGPERHRPFNLSLLPHRGPYRADADGVTPQDGQGPRRVRPSHDLGSVDSHLLGLADHGDLPRSVRPVDCIEEEPSACYASKLHTRNSFVPGAGPFDRRQL
jgi:hypothetical protein